MAPLEAPGDGKVSINSFEKNDYSDTDSERSLLLARTSTDRLDDLRTQSHNQTFEAFGDVSYYRPVEQYEGGHRYDPKFEWRPKEEKRLVRKVRNYPLHGKEGNLMPSDPVGYSHMFLGMFDVLRAPT